jgi:hypothetical protein
MGARGIAWIAAALLTLVAAAPASAAEWLAGDGHVHTCYSGDAWCGPGMDDDPIDEELAFYSLGGSVAERFAEASLKGLDFLVISDHNDVRAHADPAFGANGVTGIRAYEASLSGGHAQIIGARRLYDEGNGGALATTSLADALRADGGTFQANHPGYRLVGEPLMSCAETAGPRMNWQYGFTVLPDTIEVWNATSLLRPAEYFWECWLQRGARIGALAGSDSHGGNHLNIGVPLTWAYAKSNSEADVLAAIRAGRTTLSRVAPEGAVRLLLEADRDRNGSFESMIGDSVPPGTPMRVRTEGAPGAAFLSVRANGRPLQDDRVLQPGQQSRFNAPAQPGWVRATLYLDNGGVSALDPSCAIPEEIGETPPISTCTEDLSVAAMTSPMWIGEPPAPPPGGGTPVDPPPPPPRVDPPPESPPQPRPESEEPDRQPPITPQQEGGYQPLPNVPPQGETPPPVSKLRATWFRAAAARHRSMRVRLRWKAAQGPFHVQYRRAGSKKWRTLAARTQQRQRIVRLSRGKWQLRVRAVPAFSPAGPWRSLTIRL